MDDSEKNLINVLPEINRKDLCHGDFMRICNEMERLKGAACCTECEFLQLCRALDCINFTDAWHEEEEKMSVHIQAGLDYYEEKVRILHGYMSRYGKE